MCCTFITAVRHTLSLYCTTLKSLVQFQGLKRLGDLSVCVGVPIKNIWAQFDSYCCRLVMKLL